MHRPQAPRIIALSLSLVGPATLARPHSILARSECTDLSTTSPNWQVTNALSSDWPGSGSGRVELFAHHVPTGLTASCAVNYALDQETGAVIDYDPAATHACVNFAQSTSLNTTVRLDIDTLTLTLRSTWACDEDEEGEEGEGGVGVTTYAATGSGTLSRNTTADPCTFEQSQMGPVTDCRIGNVDIEGTLEVES
ncbi:hypothetical protein F4779DRAFT_637970 [Xylariaceae sp. FL0662B]|nr:hypothetical protein F4779DRAFT_637970 [Xylariaceae sp. FL0662B]